MSARSAVPFSWELAHSIMTLIDTRTDLAAPSLQEFMEFALVPRRKVRLMLQALADRGILDIEERGEGTSKQYRYRRATSQRGTLWTGNRKRPRRQGRNQ
ncbi:MAG: hypothetical protein KIT25_06435 [Enhydrobacter sp.]|nr:MAG: hypothetical protein KIT25_06435 [Enhydrobacter sp.]